jgi:chromosome segregation ATPase
MPLTTQTHQQTVAHPIAQWAERERHFERQQAAFLERNLVLQDRCRWLREKVNSLEQERGLLEQERLHLWKDVQAKWQPDGKHEQQLRSSKERNQIAQTCLSALSQEHHTSQDSRQAFQDKLRILREQRKALREIPDSTQRQQAFQQLQAEYLQLQQTLQERRASYHRLRSDYEAQLALVCAEKLAIRQRQEERRWQKLSFAYI